MAGASINSRGLLSIYLSSPFSSSLKISSKEPIKAVQSLLRYHLTCLLKARIQAVNMKRYIALLFTAAAMAFTKTTTTPEDIEECGDLGVMQVDPKDVPWWVRMTVRNSDIRKCAEHPAANGRDTSELEGDPDEDVEE